MQRQTSTTLANASDEIQARSQSSIGRVSVRRPRRIAATMSAAVLLVLFGADAGAQNAGQNAIDRNLLLRQQQQQDLQNRLNDGARTTTPGLSEPPQLPAPQLPPSDLQSQQLYQSQQQRQLEQQSQNRLLPPSLQDNKIRLSCNSFSVKTRRRSSNARSKAIPAAWFRAALMARR